MILGPVDDGRWKEVGRAVRFHVGIRCMERKASLLLFFIFVSIFHHEQKSNFD